MSAELRRPDPRRARSRAAALGAAREILAAEGWDAVTYQRVAEQSGLGRVTLYRHWPHPSCLLHDAIAEEATAAHIEPTGDLRADLIGELEVFRFELADRHFAPVLATLIDRAEWDRAFHDLKTSLVRQATTVFRAVLRAGVTAGSLEPETDVDAVVAELVGPLTYRRLVSGEAVSGGFVESLVDDVLAAHAAPRQSDPNPHHRTEVELCSGHLEGRG